MEGLTVKEASLQLGIDEKTVRSRIKAGTLPAIKVSRPQGYIWRVYPDGLPKDAQVEIQVGPPPAQVDAHVEPAPLVQLVEKLHAENTQLAGQVGFLQAKLQEATERIKLLEVAQDPEPKPRVLWWRRWFSR